MTIMRKDSQLKIRNEWGGGEFFFFYIFKFDLKDEITKIFPEYVIVYTIFYSP